MATIAVEALRFVFPPSMAAAKYDDWQHYREVWLLAGGRRAVDIVATRIQAAPATVWLIEAKDFRVISNPPEPSNVSGLAQTVFDKVDDTLAGPRDAAAHAAEIKERSHANRAIKAKTRRVVLHLEPHTGKHSALFPSNFAASVLQKLRQLVRAIDRNPLMVCLAKPGDVP